MANTKPRQPCSIQGCEHTSRGHGLCSKHYTRFRRYGDSNITSYDLTREKRFWAKVDKTLGRGPWGTCWLWTGSVDHRGYGKFTFAGRGTTIRATQALWRLLYGYVPSGLEILHACDNPPCVRPTHLREGTHQENMHDALVRGRAFRKYSDIAVLRVRQLRSQGLTYKKIASMTSVKAPSVAQICSGRQWKHLLGV